ncbi:MAG: hypothetical protein RL621_268 [Bacteroidota bacterium]
MKSLLTFLFTFISILILPSSSLAGLCNGGSILSTALTISSNCDGASTTPLQLDSGGNVTINSGVTVSNDRWSTRNGDPIHILSSSTSAIITNNGSIYTASQWAVTNYGINTEIYNNGTLSSGSRRAIVNGSDAATFSVITNLGTISGPFSDITNSNVAGSIVTFNNLQGGSDAVTYSGALPTNYNIIINSTTNYGKLSGGSGATTFGIYAGSTVTLGTYTSVLTGLTLSNLISTTGTFSGLTWTLLNSAGTTWDLVFSLSGPSSTDTQSSLKTLASRLRSSYNHTSLISNFPNSNTYDCNLFDVKGMCISAGGRYSTVDNPSSNSTAAVVTLGYKVSPSIRIGGFLDQSVNNNNPTGVHLSNKNPMMGAFAYWNQQPDGLGYQVKIANAYQDKDLSTTRDVIGTSEAGTGKTSLTTQSYVGELSYAFMYKENTLVRPYFALRHTSIEQDAYTETGVTTPLTYSALNDRTTSALMGVKFKHAITEKTKLTGSLGVEQDLHHKTDQLTASGVSGLTSENFSGNLHRTRPVASIGATYDIAKTQRLSGEVLVQQLPFQSTAGATAYFNYMIGF